MRHIRSIRLVNGGWHPPCMRHTRPIRLENWAFHSAIKTSWHPFQSGYNQQQRNYNIVLPGCSLWNFFLGERCSFVLYSSSFCCNHSKTFEHTFDKLSLIERWHITHSQQDVPIDVSIVFFNRLNYTYYAILNIGM